MIPSTFAKFRKGITKHADMLRRHGLMDVAERNAGYSGRMVKGQRGKRVVKEYLKPDAEE